MEDKVLFDVSSLRWFSTSKISDLTKVHGLPFREDCNLVSERRRNQIKPFVREEEDCVRATRPNKPNVAQSYHL